MDKSKLAAIGLLVILGGGIYLAQSQDAPKSSAVEHDHDGDGTADHDDSAHEGQGATIEPTPSTSASSTSATGDLAGGIKELEIEDIRKGTGAEAKKGNNLTMNYKGQLLNGEVFDQSYGREPFQFQLGTGAVIKGWDKGILGMKEGGKRKLTIPSDLAYGDSGAGGKIPPGATLVFEVELIKVDK